MKKFDDVTVIEGIWCLLWYYRKGIAITLLLSACFTLGDMAYTYKDNAEQFKSLVIDQQVDMHKAEELADEYYRDNVYLATRVSNLQLENAAIMDRKVSAKASEYDVQGFELTAYCACELCCGPSAQGVTFSGTTVESGRTLAVDPSVIPIGSLVYIDGLGLRVAEDTGSAIKGNIVDVYFEDHDEALRFGRQTANVVIIEEGLR